MSNQIFHFSNSGISSGQRFYLKDDVSGIFLRNLNIDSNFPVVASNLIYNTGNQIISGNKTFRDTLSVRTISGLSGVGFSSTSIQIKAIDRAIAFGPNSFGGSVDLIGGSGSSVPGDINLYAGADSNGPYAGGIYALGNIYINGDNKNRAVVIYKTGAAEATSNIFIQQNSVDVNNAFSISGVQVTPALYATSANLASTGSILDNKINSLSGSSVLIFGDQTISGVKTFNDGLATKYISGVSGSNLNIIGYSGRSVNINAGNSSVAGRAGDVTLTAGNSANSIPGSINLIAGTGRSQGDGSTPVGINLYAGQSPRYDGDNNIFGNINVNYITNVASPVITPKTISIYRSGNVIVPLPSPRLVPAQQLGVFIDNNKVDVNNGMVLQVSGVNVTPEIYVNTTSDQTISGIKTFTSRPTVNGTGVLLIGEAAGVGQDIVYTTGNQNISGVKNFYSRPTVNGTGVFLSGGSILSTQISDSTTAGRALLTAATVQAQRTALDIFVSAANLASFPASGNFQRIYLALDTQKTYVWNGIGYTEISPNTHTRAGAANINVGETALASASLAGSNNTAVGVNALAINTSGGNNSAYGTNALANNVVGSNNTAFGAGALQLSNANNNTAYGTSALKSNQNGVNNVAVGISALQECDSYNNTAIGQGSLFACTSGNSNAALGLNAGATVQGGVRNTLLGTQSDVDNQARNNCVVIGANTTSPAVDGSLAIGGVGGNAMTGLITSSSPTDYLRLWLNGIAYMAPIQLQNATARFVLDNDSRYVTSSGLLVYTTGDQIISGVKTFANGSNQILNTTYSTLTGLKATSRLLSGQLYRISDFVLKWNNQSYNDLTVKTAASGEPLIVTALSNNKISHLAQSEIYPQDTIYYNIDASGSYSWGNINNNEAIPNFKGWIYRRVDNLLNINIPYDWRNITVNCCKPDVSSVSGYLPNYQYTRLDYVKETSNNSNRGKLYYSVVTGNSGNALNNTSFWSPVSDFVESGTFFSTDESYAFRALYDGLNLGDFIINLPALTSSRIQQPTFTSTLTGLGTFTLNNVKNIKIEGGYSNVIIGNDFSSNTISNDFYSNTIGNNFYSNTISNNFNSNAIGDFFSYNTIGNNFYYNTIGNNFKSNTISNGSDFISNSFNFNTIGNLFSSNTISNLFYSNTIGNNFYFNTIGNGFNANTIGNGFNANTIGIGFAFNTIRNGFKANTSESNFYSIDFSSSTHVYNSYNTTLFQNSANSMRLRYFNSSDQLVVTDPTA